MVDLSTFINYISSNIGRYTIYIHRLFNLLNYLLLNKFKKLGISFINVSSVSTKIVSAIIDTFLVDFHTRN